jgi:hypothetical protein
VNYGDLVTRLLSIHIHFQQPLSRQKQCEDKVSSHSNLYLRALGLQAEKKGMVIGMKDYLEQDWNFLNMNSPADLYADYRPDGVHLCEYDRCRDGHALVSRFYVNGEDTSFQTQVIQLGAGIGIGLYYGDGCYRDYLLVAADKKGVSVRIPNGVPQGDTFRMEGPKRYYEIASKKICLENTFTIGFKKEKNNFIVYVDDKIILEIEKLILPFQGNKKNAKLMVKAFNEELKNPKSESVIRGFRVEGVAPCYDFTGVCTDMITEDILPEVYVHVLGEYEKWAKTNEEGRFVITQLPYGSYRLAYGMEGKEFLVLEGIHDGTDKKIKLDFSNIETEREDTPQENLKSNLPFIGLNGIWKFEFDRDNAGEKEEWYLNGNHEFSKCIRVPFSWQSLKAFGEEELVDEYSLHQANSYTCNAKEIGETGWYQRTFSLSDKEAVNEFELAFAAISGTAKIWLDQRLIGCTTDSYNKYTFSLGKLKSNQEYVLTVKVTYEHGNNWACSGKQGFWFTDSPGIWQNVWLRERRNIAVTDILIDNNFINDTETKVNFHLEMSASGKERVCVKTSKNRFDISVIQCGYYKIIVDYVTKNEADCEFLINGKQTGMHLLFDAVHGEYFDQRECYCYLNAGENDIEFSAKEQEFYIINTYVERIETDTEIDLWMDDVKVAALLPEVNLKTGKLESKVTYNLKNTKLWSPEKPYQYQITARVRNNNDEIEFTRKLGIRKVDISPEDNLGGRYIRLNDRKTYIRGVLDQGYNPWGIYTYPKLRGKTAGCAEYDIMAAKECGYNLTRMHIKDNETDWYELCDESGMMVWDETPSNFYGVAEDSHWQSMFKREIRQMTKKHNYHASVILCSIINESWGITGDHEKSPWNNPLGQKLIKEYARYYKAHHRQSLVIDNSGYGKTSETQVIDHHSYPGGFEDARDFFGRIAEQNYPGSHFNFFNSKNMELFQNDQILDLLQRNCSQDLKNLDFTGDEVQNGQPVLISEFVHTDKQEELVRMFPKIAGYIRMNIASQENEDTSPLTASRIRRDFGFVKEDFTKASYQMANSENLVYMDYPFLSKVVENDEIAVPIYVSLWGKGLSKQAEIEISWKFIGIDELGVYKEIQIKGSYKGITETQKPLLSETLKIKVPSGLKGGYLFVKLLLGQQELATTYIQLEIFPKTKADLGEEINPACLELKPSDIKRIEGFHYNHIFEKHARNVVWGYGNGSIGYKVPCSQDGFAKAVLVMELSDCICMDGTRETDEKLEDGYAKLYIQNEFVELIRIKGQSCDRRAIFSNSGSSEEKITNYAQTGTYGYGNRIEIELPSPIVEKMKKDRAVTVRLEAMGKGITIYGNRMGSHGCNPMILLKY